MLDLDHFFSQQPNATLVTVTRRLARHLLDTYHRQQLDKGLTAWSTPDIIPWSAWVLREWRSWAVENQVDINLVSQTQSLQLWQTIIESDSDALINVEATARHAQSARKLVIDYALDLNDKENISQFVYDADASHWMDWHQQYQQKLTSLHQQDNAGISQQLIQVVEQGGRQFAGVGFIGFDGYTPLQYYLIYQLKTSSQWIEVADSRCGQAIPRLCEVDNPKEEIYQAAHWARHEFEKHWQPGDSSIGVVIPQLEQQRHEVARIFREVFYPQDGPLSNDSGQYRLQGMRDTSVFNLSMGYSLALEPVIQTALQVLSLCHVNFEYEQFSQLLRSDFIHQGKEQAALRSLLDVQLRRYTHAESSLYDLLVAMPEIKTNTCAEDVQQWINKLSELKQQWRDCAKPSQWIERIYQCLKLFGWPNCDAGDSYHGQVMQSLDEVLFDFSRLDQQQIEMGLSQAISRLTRMIQSRIFQPASESSPVQVLGILESAGMQFSALWVSGMNEQDWPPVSQPNPFIPLRLQRQHSMPHCSPAHEYDYATRQTHRLIHSANKITFSFARNGSNEESFLPSPLVEQFRLFVPDQVVPDDITDHIKFDYLVDDQGPTVDADYCQQRQTGTQAMKDQAACPFRAFVTHRLEARLPESLEPGNDPRLRGEVVHQIMQELWQQWVTSDVLRELSYEVLAEQVRQTIERTVQKQAWRISADHALEQQRLFNLVMEWLEWEKQRQPFDVKALEQETEYQLGKLKLKMFIDRIDTLADGSQCIIDYKTGEARAVQWVGERPDEPQLPIYALSQQSCGDVNAIAFANVRYGECKYEGATSDRALVAVDDKVLGNVRQIPVTRGLSALKCYQDWPAMLSEWQQVINRLADEYSAGHAEVDPKSWPALTSCQYCDIKPVCRIYDLEESLDGIAEYTDE